MRGGTVRSYEYAAPWPWPTMSVC